MNKKTSYKMEIPMWRNNGNNEKSIYNNFHKYSNSPISKDYVNKRLSIFNMIQKISIEMGFISQIFFVSAYYLDILFMKNKKKRIDIFFYKIGLALCLMAKYCENKSIVPKLRYFVIIYNEVMGHKSVISLSDLMDGEVLLCKLLNYNLNYYSIYDFNAFFFWHGI